MSAEQKKRTLLFVVGMHRSGTSALSAAFCACGATTGDDVLSPMEGVNSEGFWEDRELVALNERLLQQKNVDWYSIDPGCNIYDEWPQAYYQQARSLIERGFGDGDVELLKDPRLTVTLPFWLKVCDDVGVVSKVCVIKRNIDEVALSLQKRDGFPLVYGQWLAENYQQYIEKILLEPIPVAETSYDQLLDAPSAVLTTLVDELALPLAVDSTAVLTAIKARLKHQFKSSSADQEQLLASPDEFVLLREMARAFVARGKQLTELGDKHTLALSVIGERDTQLECTNNELNRLGNEHDRALALITQRDGQLKDVQVQLDKLGKEHEYALSIVSERDQQLNNVQDQLSKLGKEHEHAQLIVAERDKQLEIHRSWKKKILLSLGFIKYEE